MPTADKAISFTVAAAPPVGQTLDQLLGTMGINTWSSFTMNGMTAAMIGTIANSPIDTYFNQGYWCEQEKKAFAICQSHGDPLQSRELEWLDATNVWTDTTVPPVPNTYQGHGYCSTGYDPVTGDRYYAPYNNNIFFRKPIGGSWTNHGVMPGLNSSTHACAFHPNLGPQGSLIIASAYGVARWDKATTNRSMLQGFVSAGDVSYYYCNDAYDPDTQSVYYGGGEVLSGAVGRDFWQVSNTGVITRRPDFPSGVSYTGGTSQFGMLISGWVGTKMAVLEGNGNIREYTPHTGWGSVITTRPFPLQSSWVHWHISMPNKGCVLFVYDNNGSYGRSFYVWKRSNPT